MKYPLALAALIGLSAVSSAQQMFEIRFENLGPQPLSALFWSAGNDSFDIFQLGGTASQGIKDIAERGNTTAMMGIAAAAGSNVSAFGTIPGGGVPPGGVRTATFTTDAARPYFSFASMVARTNDGFIGESFSSSGLNLFSLGQPNTFSMLITGLRAWDAGTELNTQNAADVPGFGGTGNPMDSDTSIRIHDTIIPNFGDSWQSMPDWELNTSLARVTVTPVPEPGTMAALGVAVAALMRRKRRQAAN